MLGGTAIVKMMLRGSATVTFVPVLVGGAPVLGGSCCSAGASSRVFASLSCRCTSSSCRCVTGRSELGFGVPTKKRPEKATNSSPPTMPPTINRTPPLRLPCWE